MLKRFLRWLLIPALLIEIFVALAKQFWFFELFTHYALHYALLASLFTLLAVWKRQFKTALL